jgi:phosphatidate cytidylyltransferase
MFKTRLISGIICLVIAVAAMLAGGPILFAFVCLISFIGQFELYRAHHLERTLAAYAGYAGTALLALAMWLQIRDGVLMAAAFAALMIMAVYVFTFPKFKAEQIFYILGGFLYVPVLMSFIYQVRLLPDGLYVIPMIFICAWGNDTCAYCVGVLIGKHKMFPVLSPKKSVEGFVGGIAGAVILGVIYGILFGAHLTSLAAPVPACGIIGGVGALIAVAGDLAASAVKRDTGIKDYGRLIPGHGGILDRFDSILFTAPIVYILAVLLSSAK